jgi:hypothetical protein
MIPYNKNNKRLIKRDLQKDNFTKKQKFYQQKRKVFFQCEYFNRADDRFRTIS